VKEHEKTYSWGLLRRCCYWLRFTRYTVQTSPIHVWFTEWGLSLFSSVSVRICCTKCQRFEWLSLPLRIRNFRIQILVWRQRIMIAGVLRSVHFKLEYCHTNRQPPLPHKIICSSSLRIMLPLYVVVEKVSLNKKKNPWIY